jgi:hypothetical protein
MIDVCLVENTKSLVSMVNGERELPTNCMSSRSKALSNCDERSLVSYMQSVWASPECGLSKPKIAQQSPRRRFVLRIVSIVTIRQMVHSNLQFLDLKVIRIYAASSILR